MANPAEGESTQELRISATAQLLPEDHYRCLTAGMEIQVIIFVEDVVFTDNTCDSIGLGTRSIK